MMARTRVKTKRIQAATAAVKVLICLAVMIAILAVPTQAFGLGMPQEGEELTRTTQTATQTATQTTTQTPALSSTSTDIRVPSPDYTGIYKQANGEYYHFYKGKWQKNATYIYDKKYYIKDGMEVQILDQLSVSIIYDGKTTTEVVNSAVVADVLDELGVKLGEADEVTPAINSSIADGGTITVNRVKYETVTETETIDYEVAYEYDGSQTVGTEYTSVYGEEGEREITYRVKFVNGEETEREISEEKVTKEPVTAVVVIGTYEAPQRVEVARRKCPDCNDPSHGYYEVDYREPDGTIVTEYEDY